MTNQLETTPSFSNRRDIPTDRIEHLGFFKAIAVHFFRDGVNEVLATSITKEALEFCNRLGRNRYERTPYLFCANLNPVFRSYDKHIHVLEPFNSPFHAPAAAFGGGEDCPISNPGQTLITTTDRSPQFRLPP